MTHFSIGKQSIIIGDCLQCLPELPDQSIDVVVTSCPYNLGIAYNSYNDQKPREDYLAWLERIALAVKQVMKPNASCFLNVGSTSVDPWLAWDVASMFRHHFVLQNHIVWVKSISIENDTVGHFKPINSRRYLNHNHESIFQFTKTGTVPIDRLSIGVEFKDKTNIRRRGHMQDKRCAGNVWFIPYQTVRSKAEKFDHPAGFPVGLPLRCIKLHGVTEQSIVLDPFAGTGATLLAADQLGGRGIGIELDPVYAETAVRRLQPRTLQEARRRRSAGSPLGEAPGRV